MDHWSHFAAYWTYVWVDWLDFKCYMHIFAEFQLGHWFCLEFLSFLLRFVSLANQLLLLCGKVYFILLNSPSMHLFASRNSYIEYCCWLCSILNSFKKFILPSNKSCFSKNNWIQCFFQQLALVYQLFNWYFISELLQDIISFNFDLFNFWR